MFKRINHKLLFILALTMALLLALTSIAMAAMWTDQADYSPGSVVTISGDNSDGAGYLPGETVHVDVVGPNGYTAVCDAVADAEGAWSCTVTLWDSDLAVGDYSYTATGQDSGVSQSGIFTDAHKFLITFAGTGSGSVTVTVNSGTLKIQTPGSCSGSTQNSDQSITIIGTCELSTSDNYATGELSVSAASSSAFSGWSDANWTGSPTTCTGTNSPCDLIMDNKERSVTITFNPTPSMLDQTITIGTHAPGNAAYGDTFTVAATASSSLPVTYSSSGGCSNVGATFTMTSSTVTCVVHYNQTGDATYNPAPEVTENVTAGKATLTVTPDAQSMTYGDPVPAYTFSVIGFKNSENAGTAAGYVAPACSSDYAPSTPVANSPRNISCSGGSADNYSFSYNTAQLTIAKATLTVTPDAKSMTYGDPVPVYTFGVAGFKNSETAETAANYVAPTCSSDYAPTTPVANSPRTISCSGGSADNYSFDTSATAELTIAKATLTVTPDAKSMTYGDPVPVYTFGVAGFKNYETAETAANYVAPTCSSDYAPTTPVADSPRTISCSGGSADNYSFDTSATAELTIAKAILTVTVDEDLTMILHASTLPDLTYTITGFKNDEDKSVIDTLPTCSTTATSISPVGSYPVTCSGGIANNYDFAYVAGWLKVIYATGGMCLGSPSHQILQPINTDGSSVFKQKSTVPAKFRVCDANGVSIGDSDVVSEFLLVKVTNGAVSTPNEIVDSTTPFTEFRWSATDQQWIFNISTKNYSASKTYFFEITLNDGSKIPFSFGLK
jgi:hypothetical protein